ncbi:hypothetical protein VTK26DRAFT_7255 [Humicola hyalothermophila]
MCPTMPPKPQLHLSDTPTPPAPLLPLLHAHLPYSLPVLRRLQFAQHFPGGRSPHIHVLFAYHRNDDGGGDDDDDEGINHFTAACVDLSRAPETQCWIYSTLEDGRSGVEGREGEIGGGVNGAGNGGGEKEEEGVEEVKGMELVMAVMRRIRRIALAGLTEEGGDGEGSRAREEGAVLVGSLHETIRQGMLRRGVRMDAPDNVDPEVGWEFCGKWLFRVEDLPLVEQVDGDGGKAVVRLPNGMCWDRARREDIPLVLSRTAIARQEKTLLMLPSVVVRLGNGAPVAWAFMGLDGTIISLHVEEPYRRLGLAKAVACKLMREHLNEYGDDGWGAADVFILNHKSQGFCKSIGGKNSWMHSWAVIHLSSVGDPF